MKDFLETLVHLYAFCLFVRAVFPSVSEGFLHPVARFICDITDPVLLFLKKNSLSATPTNALFPLFLLLFLKAALIRSLVQIPLSWNTVFLISVYGFICFLFKVYVLFFWLIFSANRYRFFGSFFSLLSALVDQTLASIPGIKKDVSVSQNAPKAFGILLAVFYVLFLILIALEGFKSSLFSFQAVLEGSLRIFLQAFLDLLDFLPFLIFLRVILSFFTLSASLALEILVALTEPILEPFRKMRLIVGVFDFSPVVALVILSFALDFFHRILH
jgi:YggT family protein